MTKNTFRSTTADDLEEVARLATRVFSLPPQNPFRNRPYLEWKYWQPHPDWDGSRSYCMDRDGSIAAHGCAWPMRFLSESGERRGQYLIDWVADAAVPGIGIVLLRKMAALTDVMCVIGGSEMTLSILPRLGFRPFNEMWSFARPLRPFTQALTHQFRNWKLPLRLIRNTAWSWWPPLPPVNDWTMTGCRPADLPPDVWPRPANGWIVCGRSPALFEYLLSCPTVKFSFHGLSRNGKLQGYFCLTCILGQARIADLWVCSQSLEDWQAAYVLAFRTARRFPDAAEVVAAASTELGRQALQQCGFRLFEKWPITLCGSPDFLSGVKEFHLQMIDSDGAFWHEEHRDYRT